MAKLAIKSENQKQLLLFPPSLDELVPKTDVVRLVNLIIDRLDLSSIMRTYNGGGNSCYNPKMMLKILVYAYLNNIHSSRKIEQELHQNINFMWLSGMSKPDFRTINYFRGKRLKDQFEPIFVQVVELLYKEGLVSLNVQYIDGTKIESAANKYTFVWRKSIERYDARLKSKTHELLSQIEANNALESSENPLKEDLTAEDFSNRVKSIKENTNAKDLSKEDRKVLKDIEKEKLPRMHKYAKDLEIMKDRNSYSKTDKDATFMRMKEDAMKNGQLKPGYNIQMSTENQFITNYAIYQRPTDTLTLIPYLKDFERKFNMQSSVIVADSGYGSEENYEYLFMKGITPYVKYNMFHKEQKRKYTNNPYLPSNLYYNKHEDYYVCPMGQHMEYVKKDKRLSASLYQSTVSVYKSKRCTSCPLRGSCHKSKGNRRMEINHKLNHYKERIRQLLMSEEGLRHRSKRPIEPEAVFGHIKECGQFRRFRLRGLDGVNIEFGLKALAHNIKKMMNYLNKTLKSTVFDSKIHLFWAKITFYKDISRFFLLEIHYTLK